ncbi:MAG: hypothetical protein HFACDABA_03233 [Anaerolineales bacterium]|nr:hypothetical protein [Anaerolineales bacterium]
MKRLPRLAPRDWIGFGLVLVGFILRLRQYLANRSLWLDEAMLTNNILSRNFGGLFQQLDNNQGAPIGFLLAQKFITLVIGDSEYALRLIPLIAGILSLALMFALTRKISNAVAGNLALGFFAVAPSLVYYSSEVKQYSSDAAIALALSLLYIKYVQAEIKLRGAILIALAGALAVWFSHPAFFTVGALGFALFLPSVFAKNKNRIVTLIVIAVAWLLNLSALYALNLRQLSTHQFFLDYWRAGFMPHDSSAPSWLAYSLQGPFHDLLDLQTNYIFAVLLFLIGWIGLTRRNPRFGFFLLAVFFLALLAAFLTLYPFAGRMILFLAPLLILLLAEGIESIASLFTRSAVIAWTVGILLAVYLLYSPLAVSVENFIAPKYQEHIRPTMEYLRDFRKPGDLIYVYYWAEHAVRYYAPKYGMDMPAFTLGADHHEDPMVYLSDLEALRGHGRVWILFSHVYENGDFNERDFILGLLDSMGEQLRQFREPGTSVYLYLYDLR